MSSLLPFVKDRVSIVTVRMPICFVRNNCLSSWNFRIPDFQISSHYSHILYKTDKITLYPYDIDIYFCCCGLKMILSVRKRKIFIYSNRN